MILTSLLCNGQRTTKDVLLFSTWMKLWYTHETEQSGLVRTLTGCSRCVCFRWACVVFFQPVFFLLSIKQFVKQILKDSCEILVWTAGVKQYAQRVLRRIDKTSVLSFCICRHDAWFQVLGFFLCFVLCSANCTLCQPCSFVPFCSSLATWGGTV